MDAYPGTHRFLDVWNEAAGPLRCAAQLASDYFSTPNRPTMYALVSRRVRSPNLYALWALAEAKSQELFAVPAPVHQSHQDCSLWPLLVDECAKQHAPHGVLTPNPYKYGDLAFRLPPFAMAAEQIL